jgi:hypothetical protein
MAQQPVDSESESLSGGSSARSANPAPAAHAQPPQGQAQAQAQLPQGLIQPQPSSGLPMSVDQMRAELRRAVRTGNISMEAYEVALLQGHQHQAKGEASNDSSAIKVFTQQAAMQHQPHLLTMDINRKKRESRLAIAKERMIKDYVSKANRRLVSVQLCLRFPFHLDTDPVRKERNSAIMAAIENDCTEQLDIIRDFNRQIIIPNMPRDFLDTNGALVVDSELPFFPSFIPGCEELATLNHQIIQENRQRASVQGGGRSRNKQSDVFKPDVSGGEPWLQVVTDPATGYTAADAAPLGPYFGNMDAQLTAHRTETARLSKLVEQQQTQMQQQQAQLQSLLGSSQPGSRGRGRGSWPHGRGGRGRGGWNQGQGGNWDGQHPRTTGPTANANQRQPYWKKEE